MSKTVRERKLDSPAARAKLKASGKPYWRAIDPGVHLGYRKGLNGGKWVLRRYLGKETYHVETIGAADDHSAADGIDTFDFFQAQRKAREIAAQAKAPESPGGPFTVAAAMDSYFARLEHEGSKSLSDARGRAALHILPALGDVPVADLTRDIISQWLAGMAGKANGGRDGDATRQHRATANRVLTILRAALNQAFRDGKVASDVPWRTVKPFRDVDAPRLRYFTKDEVTRLLNAAQGNFRDLVLAALFTGCRYGELGRLRAGDLNPESGTVFVGQSKSGKARHVVLTDEARKFFETLTAGRQGDALMLAHANGLAWGHSHQIRRMVETCSAARIEPAAGFHTLRHTAASHLVMSGVPLNVVAHNLGHADTRMTERHYAHLAPSYVAETIRKFAPTFGVPDETNIVPLARG
ncbi:MAG: site-specific integrase [Pseudomonadota bacterium]|nr:site-specific integrase [Pseudomonadota bacterium]